MGSNINEASKSHIVARVHVVWPVVMFRAFAHLPRGQICTKFGTGVGVAEVITCDNFWRSFMRGRICWGGSKLRASRWQSLSPLYHCATATAHQVIGLSDNWLNECMDGWMDGWVNDSFVYLTWYKKRQNEQQKLHLCFQVQYKSTSAQQHLFTNSWSKGTAKARPWATI